MWNTQLFKVLCLIKHVANVCLSAATKKEAFRATRGRMDRSIDSQIDRYLIKCKVPFASAGGRSSKLKLSFHIYRNAEKRNVKLALHCSVQHARRKGGGINCAVATDE